MTFKFKVASINSNQLLRAIAIMFVVANHATWFSLKGGMNFLLLLSGYNFAAFSFSKTNKAIIIDLWHLIRKIAIPSMIVMISYFIINQRFEVAELFMISNWLYLNKVTDIALPIWYPQMFFQMGMLLTILFLTFPIHKLIIHNKITATIALVLISLMLFIISTSNYDSSHLYNRLPHLMLWNFVLGWSFWALLNTRDVKSKIYASLLLFCCVYIVYGRGNAQDNHLEIFLSLTLTFIWLKNVYLPHFFVTILNLISSATLYIFLLHLSFFQIYNYFIPEFTLNYKIEVLSKFTFSVFGCVLVWLLITAGNNARIRLRNHKESA